MTTADKVESVSKWSAFEEEVLNREVVNYDYIYLPNGEDIMWWRVSTWLAEQLNSSAEVEITDLGCYWWSEKSSGFALCMNGVFREVWSY